MAITVICHSCQTKMEFAEAIPRSADCPKCGSDVRACKNCEFYDRKSYNECRETQADPVREKDRSNFCGFFTVRVAGTGVGAKGGKEDLLSAAEALFKKK